MGRSRLGGSAIPESPSIDRTETMSFVRRALSENPELCFRRASLEQPSSKDVTITPPGDDRDRIARVGLKMGRTHNDALLSVRTTRRHTHTSEILTNKRAPELPCRSLITHLLALFDHSSWTVYLPIVFVFHAQMSPISPFESSYQP